MEVTKTKIKKNVWRFHIGKIFVAITKKIEGKVNPRYSLTWKVKGLLKIVRKKGMKGVIIGSEYYPADFTNYVKSKSSFSSICIKKSIRRAIREYHTRRKFYEKIDRIPKINVR